MANTDPIPLRRPPSSSRQMNIIRKAEAFVERDLRHVLSNSPFLSSKRNADTSAALVHRSEVLTGSMLGQGGFSEVYEIIGLALNPNISRQLSHEQQRRRLELQRSCVDQVTGQCRYAIKHLQSKLLETKGVEEFYHAASDLAVEALYMENLDHPNILSLRGLPLNGVQSYSEGGYDSYFIICDRLQSTLDNRIETWRRNDVGVVEKTGLALQLARALDYLHSKRIVFRDLKPQNIGFTADGSLQLFDFGLCRELPFARHEDVYSMYEMSGVGTRRYMAPEVVIHGRYNCKADVYGWSMVVWEMLSGRKPFPTYSVSEHRQRVCVEHERPRISSLVPLSLRNLLQQTWVSSVNDRPTSTDVVDVLFDLIEVTRMSHRTNPPMSPTTVTMEYHQYPVSGKPAALLHLSLPTTSISNPVVIVETEMDVTSRSLLGMAVSDFQDEEMEGFEMDSPELLDEDNHHILQPTLY